MTAEDKILNLSLINGKIMDGLFRTKLDTTVKNLQFFGIRLLNIQAYKNNLCMLARLSYKVQILDYVDFTTPPLILTFISMLISSQVRLNES